MGCTGLRILGRRAAPDGSGVGIGAALTQEDGDGLTRVVMYASGALKACELSYSTYELEFLTGRFAFGVFHDYIAASKVCWLTDHSALLAIKLQKRGRTQRWLADMMMYDFSARQEERLVRRTFEIPHTRAEHL